MPEAAQLPGPVGRIEVSWKQPPGEVAPRAVAVICHPHPLYGGTMDNKVVTTLQSAASESGLLAVRFNFRGVGASEGHFDQGEGETEDALAVLDWSLARFGLREFVLMGFSFGGLVATLAAARRLPLQLVTVAPALYALAEQPLPDMACPWLLVHGRDDDVVDCADTVTRVQGREPPVDIRLIEDTGHFFHGRLGALREIVSPVLKQRMSELQAV